MNEQQALSSATSLIREYNILYHILMHNRLVFQRVWSNTPQTPCSHLNRIFYQNFYRLQLLVMPVSEIISSRLTFWFPPIKNRMLIISIQSRRLSTRLSSFDFTQHSYLFLRYRKTEFSFFHTFP